MRKVAQGSWEGWGRGGGGGGGGRGLGSVNYLSRVGVFRSPVTLASHTDGLSEKASSRRYMKG